MKTSLIRAVVLTSIFASGTIAAEKKVIQFGSSSPDTDFFVSHMGELKATPFDGTVFDVRGENNAGTYLTYGAWGNTAFSQTGMQYAVDDLLATNFDGFAENFLRLNVTPGNVDWFDDFDAIISNAGTAGWIVGQSGDGVRGIMLDTEAYEGQLWQYSSQAYSSTKSFSEYQDQVRQRGQEFMQAIQAEAPDATIILTHAYSSVWHYLGENPNGLEGSSQALLPAFLDGMVAAAGPEIKLVDGNETTFRARTQQEFLNDRQDAVAGVLPIVQDPVRYAEKFSHSFPAWMNPGGFAAWHGDPSEFDQNYYTPEQFENALLYGLNASDQYAWVYGESLYWWNHNGTENIPAAYVDAVAGAKATANLTEGLPRLFDVRFTGGTVGAPPAVGPIVMGGITTVPQEVITPPGNSILIQETHTDSITANVFGDGNVAVFNALAGGNKYMTFAGDSPDSLPGGVASIRWDMMIDSNSSAGAIEVLYRDENVLLIGELYVDMQTGQCVWIVYSPAGTYESGSQFAGVVPIGTGVSMEVVLDFGTMQQSLYIDNVLQSSANLAASSSLGQVAFLLNNLSRGTVAIDNFQIAMNIPEPGSTTLLSMVGMATLMAAHKRKAVVLSLE